MSDKRYEANIIRTTAVEPANNLETTSAPGVWSLDEVMELQKKNKWPTVGNTTTDVDDVFSTFLYDGTGSAQTITNGIDLSGEGGLVWLKARTDVNEEHNLYDTERGATKRLISHESFAESTESQALTSFNSNGFSVGTVNMANKSGHDFVSWTFRKAPKFFDVVTYTGNFTAGTTISHNLGQTPGMIIFKDTSNTRNWYIYHRSLGKSTFLSLDQTIASFSNTFMLNNTDPTSTEFTLGEATNTNANGATYVAYLFAHHNNDGEFGPNQDQDIIKCGSFTTDANEDATIDLGFEPQFVMFKRTDSSSGGDWNVYDAMRGMQGDFLSQAALLEWNTSDAEDNTTNRIAVTPTGFKIDNYGANRSYIYMAIRRGPLAQPTSATNVFAIDNAGGGPPTFTSGFPVDMSIYKNVGSSGDWNLFDRLRGDSKELNTNSTNAESSNAGTYYNQDLMTGIGTNTGTATDAYQWMWKRAPSYFDVVAYTGTGSARTLNHNLGVAPEMIWLKQRNTSQSWDVYHAGIDASAPQDYYVQLDTTGARSNNSNRWNDTAPTSSVFTVGTAASVNGSGDTYIAYLFATVAGVSKVGSYTADGNAQNIDCGFGSGAKFVLIKRSDSTGNWFILDTARGIVAGNDPLLELNSTSAQDSGYDNMDPYNAGFTITAYGGTSPYLNISGATYIFYAIAT